MSSRPGSRPAATEEPTNDDPTRPDRVSGDDHTRTQLVIQCSGQAINPLSLKPEGPRCRVIYDGKTYRSRTDWIQRARAAGWRVSTPATDGTVNAMCPKCRGTTT